MEDDHMDSETDESDSGSNFEPDNLCDTCGDMFENRNALLRHTKIHTERRKLYNVTYECKLCDKKYKQKSRIDKHVALHEAEIRKSLQEPQEAIGEDDSGQVNYQNEENDNENCEQAEPEPEDDDDDAGCDQTEVDEETVLEFVDDENKRPVNHQNDHKPNSGQFVCETCGIAFKKRKSLATHKLSHTIADVVYECTLCENKQFKRKVSFDKHMVWHAAEKPFVCKCGRGFTKAKLLDGHDAWCNYGSRSKKTLLCDFCGKTFNNHSSLLIHKRGHTGEKPHECSICLNRYITKHSLNLHMASHSDDKPFQCDECGGCYKYKSSLTEHKRLVHKGERNYACDVCGKTYLKRERLTIHKRSHTGEKPLVCDTCGRRFADRSHHLRHVKSHSRSDFKPRPYRRPNASRRDGTTREVT